MTEQPTNMQRIAQQLIRAQTDEIRELALWLRIQAAELHGYEDWQMAVMLDGQTRAAKMSRLAELILSIPGMLDDHYTPPAITSRVRGSATPYTDWATETQQLAERVDHWTHIGTTEPAEISAGGNVMRLGPGELFTAPFGARDEFPHQPPLLPADTQCRGCGIERHRHPAPAPDQHGWYWRAMFGAVRIDAGHGTIVRVSRDSEVRETEHGVEIVPGP